MDLGIIGLFFCLLILLSYFHGPSRYYMTYLHFFTLMLISAVITFPFLFLRLKDVQNARWGFKVFQVLISSLFFRVKWEIIGEDRLKKNFPCVTVCNHQSSMDLYIQGIICCRTSGFISVAKKSALYTPLGLYGWLCCYLFIDRSRGKESREKLRAAAETCHDTGANLFLHPEGTRNTNPEFLPFKTGAFDAAVKARLPILPLVASPYYFINHEHKQFNSGRLIVSVLPPIPTTPDMDVENLAQEVRNVMQKEYKRLSSIVLQNNDFK